MISGSVPTGLVAFLFTDVEGSTRTWERDSAEMAAALEEHDRILRDVFAAHKGHVFSTAGDGFGVAFATAGEAVGASLAGQGALDQRVDLFDVRMGLHIGEAQQRDDDYFGVVVNRAARIMAAAHGGQILASAAVVTALESSPPVTDLGLHRLRDLLEPMQLMQIGPGSFPPPRSLERRRHNLPITRTHVFGLGDGITQVVEAVRSHGTVTLTGVGGVGKTRLAVEAAATLINDFDAVWFIDLAPVADDSGVTGATAAVVGVDGSDVDGLANALVMARAVVVLDNCEHVIDACADLAAALQSSCPEVVVLATSREPLGVDGEQVLPVASLPLEAGVRLFRDRASLLGQDHDADDTRAAVESICQQLDGIPLAIELAAARTAHLGVDEIAAHLDERFRLLAGGRRRSRQRHQTLEATMDWSYGLLDDDEQQGLRLASVFVGSFSPAAFAGVGARSPLAAVDVLSSLVDKSLVQLTTDGDTRYRLLETVRLYALAKLVEAGSAESTRSAHAAWFAVQVVDASGEDIDLSTWDPWPFVPFADLDNHLAALEWWQEVGDLDMLFAHCCAVGPDLAAAGWADEQHLYFRRPELVAQARSDQEAARYLAISARFANEFGSWAEQLELADAGLDREALPVTTAMLASTGANAASIRAPERVDELVDRGVAALADDHRFMVDWLDVRRVDGLVMAGRLDEAAEQLERLAAAGSHPDRGFIYAELAMVQLIRGAHDRANELVAHILTLDTQGGDLRAHACRTALAADEGDQVEAARSVLAAVAELRAGTYNLMDAEVLFGAAYAALRFGDAEHACRLLAATDPTKVRSPAAFRWYLHIRDQVSAELDKTVIKRIRLEEAATSAGEALRAEEVRLGPLAA